MRLTIAMEYGIAVILYMGLASNPLRKSESPYVTIDEISTQCDLSKNHLTKVIHILGQTDILTTIRGRRGGILLGKPLADISVGEVMRALRKISEVRQGESFQQDVRQLLTLPIQEAEQRYQEAMDQVSFTDLVEQFKTRRSGLKNPISRS